MPTILFYFLTNLARVIIASAVILMATSMMNWNRGFHVESRKHETLSGVFFLLASVFFILVGRDWITQLFSILMGVVMLIGRKRFIYFNYLARKGLFLRKNNTNQK